MDVSAEKKYFSEALYLFHETQWLHNVPVIEILTRASLDAIPKEWMEHLQALENDELNNFVVERIIKVKKCFTKKFIHVEINCSHVSVGMARFVEGVC